MKINRSVKKNKSINFVPDSLIKSFVLFFLISCSSTTKVERKDTLPEENRSAELVVEFENSQNNSAEFKLYLCKNLKEKNEDMEFACEFKVMKSLAKEEKLKYKLPPGEYYAMFAVSDRIFMPLILFETTGLKARFGYDTENVSNLLSQETVTKDLKTSNCNKEKWRDYTCPKIVLSENIRSTFRIKILSDYKFDDGGTAAIYLGSLYFTLRIGFPFFLPLIVGFVAVRRDIDHNLR